ncbi:MAG: hypothetical protein ACRECX_11350 [Methyloceanibacter sp.]
MTLTLQIRNALLALIVCLAVGLVPALAEDKDDDLRLDDAWEDAIGDQEPVLTEKQFALLNNLAFQAAAAKICDGFKLNPDKFSAGIAEATTPAPKNMSEEDAQAWNAAVLIRFGMSYGLLLAEGNDKPKKFCASATELKTDGEVPNVWQ